MDGSIYKRLNRKIILITLIVSLAPLLILGEVIYYQFTRVYEEKIEDQIRHMARAQTNAVEVFLKERTTILSTIVDTHSFDYMQNQENLSHLFKVISMRVDGLVDLGIIDSAGQHLSYAGPYDLLGLNYYQQPWFSKVMDRGEYISDVYMGYRQMPHFIIAVRGRDNSRTWVLRATIDSDVFNKLVRTAQTGRSGDAFIINKDGIYQTASRFHGTALGKSNLDARLFGNETMIIEKQKIDGKTKSYAGAWLKNNEWLLVIGQEMGEERGGLLTTRNMEIIIISLGCLVIIITTILTTRITVRRLEEANNHINEINAQLMQSDKLAALGKMATGIAHEINNPLAIISEKAGWMRDLLADEKFQESENLKEYTVSIDKIEDHVERARKVTHNMLGFARRMEPHLDDVDVNDVLDQSLELLQNYARLSNIEIKKDLYPHFPIIASDQSQLQQVFLNLLNNAIDAIGKDGVIEIKTWLDDSQIAVSIKDNGPGIPPEYQRKVFDPFFTTKATGKGTGLGLSISFSIIEKMGGTISFTSKESEGTTFTIRLPVVIPERK
ncbi:MAG: GHKL domain-containing protein [Deltaproteobacteria bacterium]|nr:GHKL domain-containing protein [Deltaproteobacteria bacterium]MBW2086919.1 GHKL domain-containing protein [Deltaproteobacteria bacterium]